jgi:hypothetical protein
VDNQPFYRVFSAIIGSFVILLPVHPSRHHELTTRKRGEGVHQTQSATIRVPLNSRKNFFLMS